MVHDHHGIAVRHQVVHHAEQPVHVRGMKTDGWLVEHIQHADGAVAHGPGELHTLAFAGRKRGAGAVKRQIAEAQIEQPSGHIQERFADVGGHRPHVGGQGFRHSAHPIRRRVQGHRAGFGQVQPAHMRGPGGDAQSCAAAVGAWAFLEEPDHTLQALLVLGFGERVLHRVHGVEVGEVEFGEIVAFLRLVKNMLFDGRPVEYDVAFFGCEFVERHVGAHAHRAAHLFHEVPHERTPWQHRAVVDAFRLVRDQGRAVYFAHDAGAGAGRAGAGRVEGEQFGAGRVEFLAAASTGDGQAGRHVQRRFIARPAMRAHVRGDAGKQESQAVEQFGHRAERRTDAGHSGPLVQGQRGRHVQYFVHLGATGLGQAASRVRGQRLQVAPRTFRIQHAERQRALSRTGDAGHAHQFAQRNVDVDVLQVMHARPAHFDRLRPLIVGHARHRSAAALSDLCSSVTPSPLSRLRPWLPPPELHGLQYHHGQRRRPNDGRESFVLGTVRHLQFELAEPA